MRPRIVFTILSLALLAMIGLSFLRNQRSRSPDKTAEPSARGAATPESGQQSQALNPDSAKTYSIQASDAPLPVMSPTATSAVIVSNRSASPDKDGLTHDEYVEKRVGE